MFTKDKNYLQGKLARLNAAITEGLRNDQLKRVQLNQSSSLIGTARPRIGAYTTTPTTTTATTTIEQATKGRGRQPVKPIKTTPTKTTTIEETTKGRVRKPVKPTLAKTTTTTTASTTTTTVTTTTADTTTTPAGTTTVKTITASEITSFLNDEEIIPVIATKTHTYLDILRARKKLKKDDISGNLKNI